MMLGRRWRVIHGVRHGDWQTRLVALAQIAVAVVAVTGAVAMVTLNPIVLLAFSAVQAFLVVGIALFVVVALFAQRTLVLEEYEEGEFIFREGDPGRHVYVVKSGAVEVLARDADGAERVINRLGPGDHFGEMALLRSAPRSATIRAATATEVLKLSPGSFAALYTNLPGVREQFNRTMAARLAELTSRPSRRG